MTKTIALSQAGSTTKSTIVENGKTKVKYGGIILDQSNNEITIRFNDGLTEVFSFSQFTTVFAQTTAAALSDYLISNGFFVDASVEGGTSVYVESEVNDAIRRSINPSIYFSYLPIGSDFTTASISANTPTKTLIPTTIKFINNFEIHDLGGGNFAVRYIGPITSRFNISMSTGMTTSSNNVLFKIRMYKNGEIEPGIGIVRKIGTGADIGAISVTGEFELNPNDYIEVFVDLTLASTVTFIETAILITESN